MGPFGASGPSGAHAWHTAQRFFLWKCVWKDAIWPLGALAEISQWSHRVNPPVFQGL